MSRYAKKIIGGIAVTAAVICAVNLCGCSAPEPEVGKVTEDAATNDEVRLSEAELIAAPKQSYTSKEESVSVKADPSGAPYDIKVSETLAIDGEKGMIEDRSTLSDIANPEGDEDYYILSDGSILWDNNGNDITYEGRTDKELPVGVSIHYYLGKKEYTPGEMAGKSGKFKMVFEYTNDIDIPFTAVSLASFSKDNFSGIKVLDGKVVNMGDDLMVIGYAMPGIRDRLGLSDCELTEDIKINEKVVITGECSGFKMDYTSTVFSNGLFSEIDSKDIKDLKKISKRSDKLQDATKKLVDGSDKLSDGAGDIEKYISRYVKGVSEIRTGTDSIKKAMATLDESKKDLKKGSRGLKDGLSKMNDALKDIDTDMLTAALAQNPELAQLGPLLASLKESTAALYKGATALDKGVTAYTGGVSEVYKGMKKLDSGAASLSSAGKKLEKGTRSLVSGLNKYKKAIRKYDEKGIKKLTKLTGKDYIKVVNNLKKLRKADKEYVSFTGDASGKDDSVVFVFETDEIAEK